MTNIISSPFLLLLLVAAGARADENQHQLVSPDGKIQLTFALNDGKPTYAVSLKQRLLIAPSGVGFRFRGPPMVGGFRIAKIERTSFDETWRPVWGTAATVRNHYNQMVVSLQEERGLRRILNVHLRAYDDGVALRFEFPAQPHFSRFRIVDEKTQFNFAEGATAWWIPADFDSYEHLYRETPLQEVTAANTPLTVRMRGVCLSIHEADLTDYAGMTLQAVEGAPLSFECNLVPWPDGIKVRAATPFRTPWRTIQIAKQASGLIESNLIPNLNPPCRIEDTSWIRPMKYVGVWWGMHIKQYTWYEGPQHGATTENVKRYMDFAAAQGIPAVLVEGWNKGWRSWGKPIPQMDFLTPYADFDLEEVVRYGRQQGVSLIGHHETGGNVPDYERQLEDAFALYARLGVPAVKTGYAGRILPAGQHHHGQFMVQHYRRVVAAAARHRLMIDAHEPIKPTGIERTWPNMLTREGGRGMEYNAWSEGNPPQHTTILPFTRLLAGPMDYTPGIFKLQFDPEGKHRVHTTLAKQLALYVVLYSPLQMAADLVENYDGQPAFAFIKTVPVTWDQTRVLGGKIGEFVTIARRSGESWFIGSITNEKARVLRVPLTFLDPGRQYVAEIFADAVESNWQTSPAQIEIGRYAVDSNMILPLPLAKGGGMAVRIAPRADDDSPAPLLDFNGGVRAKLRAFGLELR